ncbi:MAG: sulfatase-like hydrolase/transferase [Chloroflexi bacterium]|nr:sulfatase-like hydrolase/transferase [Chloroflexota bacterium]
MAGSTGSKSKPNILIIGVDSLRAPNLSCYGYPRLTSPHIDQLASQGALF